MLRASNVAPYGASSSCVPTIGAGTSFPRLRLPVDVRRQEPVADQIERDGTLSEQEAHGTGVRVALDHLVPLEAVDADPVDRLVLDPELACRDQVGVAPDSVLRIVGEVVPGREGVPVVGARRIARRRDRDAVVEQVERLVRIVDAAGRELGEDPAIRELIVDHDRIARGLRALVDRKSGPQRAGVDRPEEARAGLGVDGEHEVHHLDVMVRADVAHRVRRVDAEAEEIEVVLVAQPLEVLDRGRNRQRRCRSLEGRVARVADIFDGPPTLGAQLAVPLSGRLGGGLRKFAQRLRDVIGRSLCELRLTLGRSRARRCRSDRR
jgi:hypothetical protein